jgi:hypothetical protein
MMSVSDIARNCNFGRVDVIVIDVEGHERRIIDDIDFAGLGVPVLLFEHKHVTAVDDSAVVEHLEAHGFKLRRYGRDSLAER